ncbi:hypothetical protein LTR86_000481 [Recurvomyces mirabilis]|nr:hypothetical protein LTR86_000481 [Recurvomyces mirabilis]
MEQPHVDPQGQTMPFEIQSRSFYSDEITVEDANDLCHLLDHEENLRLFRQTYGRPYEKNVSHLRHMLVNHLHDPVENGTAYALRSYEDEQAIGWLVCLPPQGVNTEREVNYSVFVDHHGLLTWETLYTLAQHCIERQGVTKIYHRTGSLTPETGEAAQKNTCMTVDGIVRRSQLVNEHEEGRVCDLYCITKERWPMAKRAVGVWLGMN